MKKLMCALAAVAACVAFADDAAVVPGANIVGYQNKGVQKNLSSQVPTFEVVSGGDLDIQNLIPAVAEPGVLESYDFAIQFYSEFGICTNSFTYIFGEDIDTGYEDGWYEQDGETLSTYSFKYGEAFMVSCTKTGGSFTYSGAVNGAEMEVPVIKNLSAQGNVRPTTVDIQDILPEVTEPSKVLESYDFAIQFYSEFGICTNSFTYIFGEDIDTGYEDGWYEQDGETLSTYEFPAGFGFRVSTTKAGKLIFPALEL